MTIICLLLFNACDVDSPVDKPFEPAHTFLVAGHVYGNPSDTGPGMHPPFVSQFHDIATQNLNKIFLTGDVVFTPNLEQWQTFKTEMDQCNTEYHIAPGNHDLQDPELYAAEIGETYSSFLANNSLFVLLDSNESNWSIAGAQLQKLQTDLAMHSSDQPVFIFVHHCIWWDAENQFADLVPNSFDGYVAPTNFASTLEPLLKNHEGDIHLFAGDFGAHGLSTKLAYHEEKNLHYYMSGMGCGALDHYLLVEQDAEGRVEVSIIALGAEPDAFGTLEDYRIF